MNNHVSSIYNELKIIFEKPYKIYFLGLIKTQKGLEMTTHLYFYSHEKYYSFSHIIEHMTDKIELKMQELNPNEITEPQGNIIKCFVPTTNLLINIEKTENTINFLSDDKKVISYFVAAYFTGDGQDNNLIKESDYEGLKKILFGGKNNDSKKGW